MLRHLDTFAGIGGFSLGLEATGGFTTAGFVEIDEDCCAVLEKTWPNVPRFNDIKTITKASLNELGTIDIVTGGFPCQDVSYNGAGAGLYGQRSGLWFELLRVIEEAQPSWCIIENVAALRSRGLEVVLGGLAAIGYDAEWNCIPATALGASHQRDRVWIVAYPAGLGVERLWPEGIEEPHALVRPFLPIRDRDGQWEVEPDFRRTNDGIAGRSHRLKQVGNAICPQIAELIGRAILRQQRITN